VLQVSAQELLEGDTLTLRCRVWNNLEITQVQFYREGKDVWGPLKGTKLSLSPLQLHHSGLYHCKGFVNNLLAHWEVKSRPVTVRVHSEFGDGDH
ncbi:FCRLA protein, partial [Sapayoa aenigma]|nr:FCRLA protein [Sapayoa aenigma]